MENESFHFTDSKVVIRLRDRVCDSPEELLSSQLFYRVLYRCIADLSRKGSHLLEVFGHSNVSEHDIRLLIETIRYLSILPGDQVMKLVSGSLVSMLNRYLESSGQSSVSRQNCNGNRIFSCRIEVRNRCG